MPKTREQLFEEFGNKAGNMGTDIHTPDGPKPMYSIYGDGQLIYATCTRELFLAWKETWFHAPDGLYYANEGSYAAREFIKDNSR